MENILGDRYKILNQLGSACFGETFLAEDLQTSPPAKVVIKSLKPIHHQTTAEITEKLFRKEASVLKDLGSHCPQIPTLNDYFCQNDHYYLVQEYIEGKNLTQMGIINSEQCLSILSSLLDTLKYIL